MRHALYFLLVFTVSVSQAAGKTYRNIFYAELGKQDGADVVVLSDAPGSEDPSRGCPTGYNLASRGFMSLKQYKVKELVCWKKDDKKPNIVIYDPKAYVFKTISLPQAKFVYLESKEEIEARESIQLQQQMIQAMNRADRLPPRILDDGPIFLDINGSSKLCIRIGPMLDCN